MTEKTKSGTGIKKYVILYAAFLVYSLSTLCAKFASSQDEFIKVVLFMGLEIVCLGIYAVVWQQALKCFPVVVAMANKGIIVIINLLWAILLFGESISIFNVIGTGIIVFGIWMVSKK